MINLEHFGPPIVTQENNYQKSDLELREQFKRHLFNTLQLMFLECILFTEVDKLPKGNYKNLPAMQRGKARNHANLL